MKRALSLTLIFLMASMVFVSVSIDFAVDAQTGDDYVPIKWALIVLGGFDYDGRGTTRSAIQKAEHWIQSRGVPYDVMHESNLTTPTDTPSLGEYSLQYANGTIKYGVAVIILNSALSPVDSSSVDSDLIYWAVGNGTNAVVFGYAIKYVPELLNVATGDVTHIDVWDGFGMNCDILETYSDGVVEYQAGTSQSLRSHSSSWKLHSKVTDIDGKTVWYDCTIRTSSWSKIDGPYGGMMNYTYGSGKVFWNEYEPDQGESDGAPFELYYIGEVWETCNWKFLAHSINFMFNQVQRIDFGLQGYKRWKGAIVHRLDQDNPLVIEAQDEDSMLAGWYYDLVICPLGEMGWDWVSLHNGLPPGYTGAPSGTTKYGTAGFHTSFDPLTSVLRRFVVYQSTPGGDWDRMKVDYNDNQDFSDDVAYGYFENQTATGIAATYYWAYIDNMASPSQVNFGFWSPMRIRHTDYSWWKTWGQAGYLSFGLHSWQHAICGTGDDADTYTYWNGTNWIHNQTWIEEKLTEAVDEMAYCFEDTGYGFEKSGVGLSGAGNYYPDETRRAWNNLSFGELATLGGGEMGGFFLRSDGKPELACGSGQVELSQEVELNSLVDAVQTLFPVIGNYAHDAGYWNPDFDVLPEHTAYSDMFRFDLAHNILEWWLDARYMWRNTANAYYKDGKIVVEYVANSTLEDFVWKFPIEYDGKYFTHFSDNRSSGQIKHFDGKYVHIEFSQGQGSQKLEATYETTPHLHITSSPIQNITQTYTPRNLTLQLWNNSGSIDIVVNCTTLGRPNSVLIDGISTDFNFDALTSNCSFNVAFTSVRTAQILWLSNFSLTLNAGWNLVSFPVIPADPSFTSILGVSDPRVLTWDGDSYVTPTTAEAGWGYLVWVLSATTVNITGTPVESYERDLPAEWSLIGSIYNATVDAETVLPDPHQLQWFNGFNYVDVTTIEPGKGYWTWTMTPTHITVEE